VYGEERRRKEQLPRRLKDQENKRRVSEMVMFLFLLLAKLRWVLRQAGLVFVFFSWRCGGVDHCNEGERESEILESVHWESES
jgi:hypothetical protein